MATRHARTSRRRAAVRPRALARQAHTASRRAAASPSLELLERFGYVVRGVLYCVMGLLALGLALGRGGAAVDPSGSLVVLARPPWGGALLVTIAIGLAAYSLWGFVRAAFDPLRRGADASGFAERLGFAWSGAAYAGIALFALRLFAGDRRAANHDSVHTTIASVLAYPAGQWVAAAIGAVTVGVGIGQFADAYRAVFRKDLKRTEMSDAEKSAVDALGRWGMVSRGVTFTLVGWFVVDGALHRNSDLVHGYAGAFTALLAAPFGGILLAAVALGFVALGVHSFACARWIRLLSSRR